MILAEAPCRIDLSGGFTDVPPFCNHHRALHVNAAVDLNVRLGIEARADRCIEVNLLNAGTIFRINLTNDTHSHDSLRLIQSAIQYFAVNTGLNIIIHSEAPTGAGLGTSGALAVALAGALHALQGSSERNREKIAEIAYSLEQRSGVLGGRQDQYAAAFGWFNQFDFFSESCNRRTIQLRPNTVKALESHFILAHPGGHRRSSTVVRSVLRAYESGDVDVKRALLALNSLAESIVVALEAEKMDLLATLLREVRYQQLRLHPEIIDGRMASVVHKLTTIGVDAVKLLGGGGSGGCLLVFAHNSPRLAKKILVANACRLVPFGFARTGLRLSRVTRFPVPFTRVNLSDNR